MKHGKLLRILFDFLNKKQFIIGLTVSFLGTTLGLLLPQFIGQLLDEEFLKKLITEKEILISLVAFFIGVYGLQALASYLLGICGSQAMNKLQKYIYNHLLNSSVSELDGYSSGDLASRLTNDMSVVLNFITVVFPNMILNIVVIGGSIYFMLKISLSLTLISFLLVPILVFVIIPVNNRLEDYYTNYQEGLGKISSRISHKFNHIRLMKAFNGEKNEQIKMSDSFDTLTDNFKKIIGLSSIQNTLVNGLMMSFIILLLVIAGMEVSKGVMSMSVLMTFVLYMTQLIDPITDISESLTELTEFSSVSKRLLEILNLAKEENQSSQNNFVESCIELKNIVFSYGKDKVLNDLSVTIKQGQHVAIVGPSGSGKSTIFSLLMKFYHDYQGEIFIGQQNLADLSEEEVRKMISYIPQDNTLFQGTIKENLLYGKNNLVTDRRINEVLNELDLTKLISNLENGLNTEITSSGTGLSEGQKQRLNIARALLLEHPIYLLDEVTASLDSVTERTISKAIDKLTAGKTRITIAHRLHTIKEADSILVLDRGGNVVDFGTHNQLLNRNKLYKDFLSDFQQAS